MDKVNNEADKNCSIIIVANKGTPHSAPTAASTQQRTHRSPSADLSRAIGSLASAVDMVESNPALRRVELGEAKVSDSSALSSPTPALDLVGGADSSRLPWPVLPVQRYAATINANVLEVSAKTGVNVNEAFLGVTTTCVERAVKSGRDVGTSKDSKKLTKLQPPKAKEKGCC